jgi:hypothetical protein
MPTAETTVNSLNRPNDNTLHRITSDERLQTDRAAQAVNTEYPPGAGVSNSSF